MKSVKNKVLAIALADIHLSVNPPVWRSAEPDWFEAMKRPLQQVCELQKEYKCPVICAGDIFDRYRGISDGWNAPPELINFALKYLPDNMYAIPGQHDLPNHQYENIEKSAYWTLVKAEKIKNLPPELLINTEYDLVIRGFPIGFAPHSITSHLRLRKGNHIYIAVVHDYIWKTGFNYINAPKENHVKRILRKLQGYDIAIFGDNHQGFQSHHDGQIIYNCGTLMRRKSDEIDYIPRVGLIFEDGSVESFYLDTSKDKYIESNNKHPTQSETSIDMKEFLDELGKLGKTALDFSDAMKEFLKRFDKEEVPDEVRSIIFDAMGD